MAAELDIPPMFDLSGKVAIVTGASKGIGKSIAQQMANHGAKVVVSSRKQEACDEVVADIKANWARGPGDAMTITCNIGYEEQCANLVRQTNEAWGPVDILVCNAAVNPYQGPVADMPDWAWEKTTTANIRSVMWLTNMVCPQMAEQGGGSVIIIGSTGGVRGSADLSLYCVTKAADMQIARNLTVEWGRSNITANCIAPSLVQTDMATTLWTDPERVRNMKMTYPMQRIGEPEDISGFAVALASRAGGWVSGQTFIVDGGMMAGSGRSDT